MVLALARIVHGAGPNPAPQTPGESYRLPARPTASAAPVIYEHSGEAGPDETFFMVGDRLTTATVLSAWGASADNPDGQEWKPRTQFLTGGYLAATMPEKAADGPFVVWAKNAAGWSAPRVLNAPEPWWCGPDRAAAGSSVRIFGRNLARRPDFAQAFVYVCQTGKPGVWAKIIKAGKYDVTFELPEKLALGEYQVWVHAGAGGEYGWGGPVKLVVTEPANKNNKPTSFAKSGGVSIELKPTASGADIQKAMDDLSARGGGIVRLPAGQFTFGGTLLVPANVTLSGTGREATTLQLTYDPAASFARINSSGWNQAPGGIQNIGDTIEYPLDVPRSGVWAVWLRYATDMKAWGRSGVSGYHTLAVDGGAPVALMNLDNTGGWGTFRWSKTATLKLEAGRHKITWKNAKGGGVGLDAFCFALDPAFVPSQNPPPKTGEGVIVLQGEDCARFVTKEGKLPSGNRAALWLAGDGATLSNLTVLGTAQVNYGVYIGSPQPGTWVNDCELRGVRIADCDGKQGENCGVYVHYARGGRIWGNELWGRAPLFISGARQCEFGRNRLVSVTRFGGNAEAAILGRTETIEECIVEGNLIASPPGGLAGGPTARRLLWFSTGHGSVSHNWIAGNGVEPPKGPGAAVGTGQARFGGVAGTDQNVGEMILFEGNHRTAYFGPLAGAGEGSVTLPKTLPPTPEDRLGNVKREQLAHDAAGRETPFWPPDVDDGSDEPPLGEYYVTVMSGCGQGQTRRVFRREGEMLMLDRPWTVAPRAGSVVAVGTAFYRNLIVGNNASDGMTGIQLWISCVENVVAGNTIARQRRPALFLYANGTTLASSMPRTWNRGVSPLFWNLCEGNRAEECSAGALVTSGDSPSLPIEFPRALGNVLRHNSFIRSRNDGVILTSRKSALGVQDSAPSIMGTVVEFNVVRDAMTGYHAGGGCDGVVFRRDHAYFWYPVSNSPEPPMGFKVDDEKAIVVQELNNVEGISGDGLKVSPSAPKGQQPGEPGKKGGARGRR